jgi:DNA-binding SARP family transcriptional activator
MLVGRLCPPLVSPGFEPTPVFGSMLRADTKAAMVWTQLAVFDSDASHLTRLARRVIERMERASDVTTAVVECTEPTIAQQFCRALDLVGDTPIRTFAVCSDEDFPHQHQERPSYRELTEDLLARLQILTRVTPSLAGEVGRAASVLPLNDLAALIDGAESSVDLVRNVTTALILGASDETRDALGVAALLGYAHPDLACVASAVSDCRTMPFWAPLERGWLRMRSSWREGIYLACRPKDRSRPFPVEDAVRDLLDSDAFDEAVEFSLDAGQPGIASDVLATSTYQRTLLDRPTALRRWVDRLPLRDRQRHAALVEAATHQHDTGHPTITSTWRPRSTNATSVAASSHPLDVRLFGRFEVAMDGATVSSWHGRLGPAVFAYLVLHRDRPVSRDVLADVFWRDVQPDAARNRVNVAIHGLRTDLRPLTETPIVVFTDNGYRLNPAIEVRVDTDAFEADLMTARTALQHGDIDRALAAWQRALRTYRDDLLASLPYEDWTFLRREALRVKSLDACESMATTLFACGRYDEAINTAERLLELDICREDIHRLIMIAHVRMERPHRALRQFRLCASQLRRELGVDPSPETVAVFDRVRTRQQL